jgi:hypothetical protein
MKVYIVTKFDDGTGEAEIVSVHATEEGARAANDRAWDSYLAEEEITLDDICLDDNGSYPWRWEFTEHEVEA